MSAEPKGLTASVAAAIVDVVKNDRECRERITKHSWLGGVLGLGGDINPLSHTPLAAFLGAGNARNAAVIVKNAWDEGRRTGDYWPKNPDDTPRGDRYLCYGHCQVGGL